MTQLSREVTLWNRTGWIAHVIFQQVTAVVCIYILWAIIDVFKVNSIMFWHAVFGTLGFALFMAEAIAIFSQDSVVSINLNRVTRGNVHKILMVLATISVCVGLGIESWSRDDKSKGHFKTTHSKLGLAAWILTLVAVLVGFLIGAGQDLKNLIRPVYVKFAHNLIGFAAFACGMISLGYGVKEVHMLLEKKSIFVYVLLGVTGFYSVISSVRSGYTQLKNIFNR